LIVLKGPQPWLNPGVVLGVAAVLVTWVAFALTGNLGADPIDTLINRFGYTALVLLMASLACTPLKVLFDWAWPIRLRRTLGLLGAGMALLHLLVYVVVDQGLALGAIVDDVVKRPFISVGFIAVVLLTPLAITSTADWVKRLGFNRWKRLHRLAYVTGTLGVVHFYLRVKKDHTVPLLFAAVLGAFFLVRVVDALRSRSRADA